MTTKHYPVTFEQRMKHERAEYLIELVFNSAAKVKEFLGGQHARKPGRRQIAA